MAACLASFSFGRAFTWATCWPQKLGRLAAEWVHVWSLTFKRPCTGNLC